MGLLLRFPYATHFIGHTFDTNSPDEPVPMRFIAPRDQPYASESLHQNPVLIPSQLDG
jgi:hypothetical protein